MDIDIKKQVWIRGHDIMAEGVIKELEKLGGLNIRNYSGKDSFNIYYIDEYNYITYRVIDSTEAFCIMKVFKELKPTSRFKDKQLLWCWNDEESQRTVRFYDALNDCTFNPYGCRIGACYKYYEPFEGEYPEWAKEALKQLKD